MSNPPLPHTPRQPFAFKSFCFSIWSSNRLTPTCTPELFWPKTTNQTTLAIIKLSFLFFPFWTSTALYPLFSWWSISVWKKRGTWVWDHLHALIKKKRVLMERRVCFHKYSKPSTAVFSWCRGDFYGFACWRPRNEPWLQRWTLWGTRFTLSCFQWMSKLEVSGIFLVKGGEGIWFGLMGDDLNWIICSVGTFFIFFLYSFPPLKKKKKEKSIYIDLWPRYLWLTLMNSVD